MFNFASPNFVQPPPLPQQSPLPRQMQHRPLDMPNIFTSQQTIAGVVTGENRPAVGRSVNVGAFDATTVPPDALSGAFPGAPSNNVVAPKQHGRGNGGGRNKRKSMNDAASTGPVKRSSRKKTVKDVKVHVVPAQTQIAQVIAPVTSVEPREARHQVQTPPAAATQKADSTSSKKTALTYQSFHEFAHMLDRYNRMTQDQREYVSARLFHMLSESEQRFCGGINVHRKPVRNVFHMLCEGLNVYPGNMKRMLKEDLRAAKLYDLMSQQHQQFTEKTLLKHTKSWYKYADDSTCAWANVTTDDIDHILMHDEKLLGRACEMCIYYFVRLNQYGRLCPKLYRSGSKQEATDATTCSAESVNTSKVKTVKTYTCLPDATSGKSETSLPPPTVTVKINGSHQGGGECAAVDGVNAPVRCGGGKNISYMYQQRENEQRSAVFSDDDDEFTTTTSDDENDDDEETRGNNVERNSQNNKELFGDPSDDDEDGEDDFVPVPADMPIVRDPRLISRKN